MTSDNDEIQKSALEVLKHIPYLPFMCLPLSALLYADLRDNKGIDAKLVTGNLRYKNQFIFKQDFSLTTGDHSSFKLWAGHAWVEVEKTIWDLSFFRSLYSEKFTKPSKPELINIFGLGRGLIAFEGPQFPGVELKYEPIDYLSDGVATGIIRGIPQMLQSVKN